MLDKEINALTEASKALESAILSKIEEVAKEKGWTEIYFGCYTTSAKGKGFVQEEPPELARLEDIYIDHISEAGLMVLWSEKNGWNN